MGQQLKGETLQCNVQCDARCAPKSGSLAEEVDALEGNLLGNEEHGSALSSSAGATAKIPPLPTHVLSNTNPFGPATPDAAAGSGVTFLGASTHVWGHFKHNDGGEYVGQYVCGRKHGEGTFSWPDGSIYAGRFRDDLMDGHGQYTWADGRRYIGQWRANKMGGEGTFFWPDGRWYEGEYSDNDKEGVGTYHWPDGRVYCGGWRGGRQHGKGLVVTKRGSQFSGEWRDGACLRLQGSEGNGIDGVAITCRGTSNALLISNGDGLPADQSEHSEADDEVPHNPGPSTNSQRTTNSGGDIADDGSPRGADVNGGRVSFVSPFSPRPAQPQAKGTAEASEPQDLDRHPQSAASSTRPLSPHATAAPTQPVSASQAAIQSGLAAHAAQPQGLVGR
eukprot:gnl/TRDRNA2_/TRDRNA2_30191_c0_seq2.p1 gnl/TRDRNA2_/TRDRNA2_30191_c0~~gnl/TRDRNA2_/TRDRNA2_30191_c0_seq2.p1  ORF type:complete len:391 (+),score=46.65 gnl/TRDRNA2_/TRDRNA2_30191_c0_seq2:44-1216(+)